MFTISHTHAVLLLGVTGSGKSPLGDRLESTDFPQYRFIHFDFGANLRAAAHSEPDTSRRHRRSDALTEDETLLLRRKLETGALLEDSEFPIALKILQNFLSHRMPSPEQEAEAVEMAAEMGNISNSQRLETVRFDGSTFGSTPSLTATHTKRTVLVLNGLPRHVGQAESLAPWMTIDAVCYLECTPESVAARLQSDVGGDRKGRTDDFEAMVRRKIALFNERTLPLVRFYERQQVPVLTIPVGATTTTDAIFAALVRNYPTPLFR